VLQQRPYTFAQTNLSPSFFACDKGADHTFRLAGDTPMRDSPLVRATCGAALGPLPPTIVPSYYDAANLALNTAAPVMKRVSRRACYTRTWLAATRPALNTRVEAVATK
jgi:hypothetical protein